MDNRRIQDKIDLELSRTYFGNTSKTPEIVPQESKPEEKKSEETQQKKDEQPKEGLKQTKDKPNSRPARPQIRKPLLVPLLIVGVVVIFAVYFFSNKYIPSAVKMVPSEKSSPETSGKETKPVFTEWNKYTAPQAIKSEEGGKTLYDFEKDNNGWEIPSWAFDKTDHVAVSMEPVSNISSNGSWALGVYSEFPGNKWSGALVEIQQYLDLSGYDKISVDIYLPPEAPAGLRGKLMLTIGEDWKFVEMTRTTRLSPGKWTTISADISEGNNTVWRRTTVDKAFKEDIRKIAIRIESNKPAYKGPFFIDNITIYPTEEQK
jgi:hypothetical protein